MGFDDSIRSHGRPRHQTPGPQYFPDPRAPHEPVWNLRIGRQSIPSPRNEKITIKPSKTAFFAAKSPSFLVSSPIPKKSVREAGPITFRPAARPKIFRRVESPLKTFCCAAIVLCVFALRLHAGETIDLSGKWSVQTNSPMSAGASAGSILLPGTLSQAGIGAPCTVKPVLPPLPTESLNLEKGILWGRSANYAAENVALMHLQQRFSYLGPAWYTRDVEVPANWTNKDVELVLERVIWKSTVWINGHYLGTRNSLTTPHRYEIGSALNPGRNHLAICVDNRRQFAIGDPHAYTEQSQTIWNGIIGHIELIARDKIRADRLELRPDLSRHGVEVSVETHNDSPGGVRVELSLQAVPDDFHGPPAALVNLEVSLPAGDSTRKIFYPMATNCEWWSEFNPKLYRMEARLKGAGVQSETDSTFGMREFKTNGREFTINGRPVFLRGTVNCCEFPKTGYPDMTGKQWEKIFSTVKACGLNHVRFHTWCPPEVAFDIADRMGIYLEVELPDWSFNIGADRAVTRFFREEGERMIREYGNHPSWVMLTMGNELKGDYSVLDTLEVHFRRLDPELLYDSTTYPRDKMPEPADDYYISQDTRCGRARGQDIFENTVPNTQTNFAAAISCVPVPFISHEVGQYCVYPNIAELPKYNGVLRSTALEAIRADLQSKGRLDEAPVYTRDSGKLAVLLYKEEIERALRTTNQAGFQLLELNDFPGQGTSTVGLFDSFWDSKGLITPRQFRRFCGPVVPLLLMPKMTFQNDETFQAGIEVANFGPTPLTNETITWMLFDGRKELGTGSFHAALIPLGHNGEIGRIHFPLSRIKAAAKLTVTVKIAGTSIQNAWNIWVYPETETGATANQVKIFTRTSPSFYQALAEGKRVLLLPERDETQFPLAGEFVPVFWNPVMFPNQPGSMGAMIDAKDPVFADFPTEDWTDWQWWELLHHSFAVDLDAIGAKADMPCRFVDKFNRNALPAAIFEARVEDGRLLVCTLDISTDLDSRIVARQLRRSILRYMNSDEFDPQAELTPVDLKVLFR